MLSLSSEGFVNNGGVYTHIADLGSSELKEVIKIVLMNGIEIMTGLDTRILIMRGGAAIWENISLITLSDLVIVPTMAPRYRKVYGQPCSEDVSKISSIDNYKARRDLAISESESLFLINNFNTLNSKVFLSFIEKNSLASFSKRGYVLMQELQHILFSHFKIDLDFRERTNGYAFLLSKKPYLKTTYGNRCVPVLRIEKFLNRFRLTQIEESMLATSYGFFKE